MTIYIYYIYIILYIYNYDDIYIYISTYDWNCTSKWSFQLLGMRKKNWPVEFPKNGDMTIPQNTWTLMVVQLVKQITRVI
jgi:hypothetical protein